MKRVGFGILWFVFLWMGAGAIGGGIAGALATRSSTGVPAKTFSEGYARGYDVGHDAGRDFGRRYGSLILAGALFVSIVATAAGLLPGTKRKVVPAQNQDSPKI